MKPDSDDTVTISVTRCGREIQVRMPILNVQYSPDEEPTSVMLGLPRVLQDAWMEDVQLFEAGQLIDLRPEEDLEAVRVAMMQLADWKEPERDAA